MEGFEAGSLVRVTKDYSDTFTSVSAGQEFEVEDFHYDEDTKRWWYNGNANGGWSNVDAPADHVELVKSAAEMNARTIPTVAEMAEEIAGNAFSNWGDKIKFTEADYSGRDGTFEIYGVSKDGLRFAAYVKVLAVEQADF